MGEDFGKNRETGAERKQGNQRKPDGRDERTGRIAGYGLLIALAMILSYVEAQVPVFFAVPGMKLGLANVVILAALYGMGAMSAVCLNLIRIVLVALLFGNGFGFLYSAAGAVLSAAVMILLKKTGVFRIVTVSIAGGVAHNVGQILMAMCLLETGRIAWYLAILWFTGMVSGALVGMLCGILCDRLRGEAGK